MFLLDFPEFSARVSRDGQTCEVKFVRGVLDRERAEFFEITARITSFEDANNPSVKHEKVNSASL